MELKPGYKQTEVGVIPEEWQVSRLGDLAEFITSGSRGWARYYSDSGSLFIRSQNVREGMLDFSDKQHVRPPSGAEGERTGARIGDVLITITGNSVGNVAYLNQDFGSAYVSQHVGLVRLKDPRLADYICRYLTPCAPGNPQIEISQSGQSKPGLNLQNLKDFRLAIPTSSVETDAISKALSDIDSAIEQLCKLIAKKRAIKQAAMQELLTGKRRLPGFEGEWETKSIGSYLDLLTGYPFPSHQYCSSGVRLLRGSNVKRGQTDWSDGLVQYWPSMTAEVAPYLLREGDLIIAMDGSLVGRSYARLTSSDLPALLLQRVARIRSATLDIGFLTHFVGSNEFISHCDAVKTVTAIPHISPADIRSFKISIPPDMKEQAAISDLLSEMDAEIDVLEQRLNKTRAIKQAMMQELLTGRIRLR